MALFSPSANDLHTLKSTPKTILITGGSSGIGLATATLLSSLNASHNLILVDLQPPPPSFTHPTSHLLIQTCDITSWVSQRTAFEAGYKKFGRIDCVFVNAGIAEHAEQFFTDELDADGALKEPDRRVLKLDMDAAADTTKLAIHYLRKNERGGEIVLTASFAGYLASAGAPLYSAAKHGLMRALKQECAKLDISISVVAPAITVTPILTANNRRMNAAPDVYAAEMAKAGVPINRPESIGLAVCWLFNEGKAGNGAGIFIQADKFSDLERGLAKSREQWMGKEMLELFRGGRGAPLFDRLEGGKAKL
ncbi:NAD(P)-binding protein [Dothidotthia symphoricarpi CBS 119687]|uniref:NAD(P)-binding protein n=1 Tax=Dothidotthia symphoricarpi CBS 119687 TaxID=1392245 RepID=A0A6A6A5J8_9PLEO|nr:NAD(P)-binding protein [Dothidotthia symphoricarpi CBS 119687]KAF2127252.1 NAD(P)-binding protein [Dothidotthia symphoricarpi CBS 119687]